MGGDDGDCKGELSLLVMVLHSDEDSFDCKELSLLVVLHRGEDSDCKSSACL